MTSSSSWIRSINAAMPRAKARSLLRAREIWIDDALCPAPGCRRVAALVIVGPPAVYVQANRISRIVRLGPSWCCRQNCRGRQNRQSGMRIRASFGTCAAHHTVCAQNAFRIAILRSGLGRMFRSQADRPFCSQSIHVRALGRAQYRGGSNVSMCTNTSLGPSRRISQAACRRPTAHTSLRSISRITPCLSAFVRRDRNTRHAHSESAPVWMTAPEQTGRAAFQSLGRSSGS